jgi:phospholipid-transporting ATPase
MRRTEPIVTTLPLSDKGLLTRCVRILQPNVQAASNTIVTAKYSVLSFWPMVLYELLHPRKRFANFYFLCVGGMQMIKAISLTGGTPSTWLALCFLILVDAFFMAKEDLARHRSDRNSNSAQVDVLAAGMDTFRRLAWSQVHVGDVVRIHSRETFPADLLILRSCTPTPGQCWVNTKPLDGESDTKLRLAPKALPAQLGRVQPSSEADDLDVAELVRVLDGGEVWCEEPNDKVNDFMGTLQLENAPPLTVNESNMLLRGCQLRNTSWVLGLVVACGTDSKINFGGSKVDAPKIGMLAKRVNKDVIGVVACLALVCIVGGSLYIMMGNTEMWYLASDGHVPEFSLAGFVKMTLRFFLLEYQFVPVSLYVSMNMIYITSKFFILQVTAYVWLIAHHSLLITHDVLITTLRFSAF